MDQCMSSLWSTKRLWEKFSPSTPAFPYQDHYTKTPYSYSFLIYRSEGRASENWERCGLGGTFGQNSSLYTLVYSPPEGPGGAFPLNKIGENVNLTILLSLVRR